MKRIALTALFAFLFLPVIAGAAVLDWSTQTLAPGQTAAGTQNAPGSGVTVSGTYNNDAAHTGNDVIVKIKNNNASATWATNSPAISDPTTNPIGSSGGFTGLNGGNTGQKSLFLYMTANNTTGVTVTIDFSLYGTAKATNVSFSLYDIDFLSGTYTDQISQIWGITATGTIGATSITGSTYSAVTGSGTSFLITGQTGNAGPTTGLGNATISFGTNAVTSVQFTWKNSSATGQQMIGLGNITYTSSPEVGTSLGAVVICGLAFGFYKFRKKAAA